MSQPRLLIGLELEALVTAHKTLPALPDQRRAQLATIVNAIAESFPSSPCGPIRALAYTPISLWDRPSGALWNVTMGATDVDWANAEHVRPFGVRVASPSFVSGGVSSGKKGEDGDGDGAWKKEISTVLKAIDATVLWKPVPADEAGLSVHISAPANEPFDLEGLKRFAMFLCRFEEALDTLGPVRTMNRNGGRTLSNRFNPLLKDLSIDEVYALIAQITDVEGLIEVMNFTGVAPVRAKSEDGTKPEDEPKQDDLQDESTSVEDAQGALKGVEEEAGVLEGEEIRTTEETAAAGEADIPAETQVGDGTEVVQDTGVVEEPVAGEQTALSEETNPTDPQDAPEPASTAEPPSTTLPVPIIGQYTVDEPTGPAFNGGYLTSQYFKVDFTHLRSSSPLKQTLIFRQHDGTTDGDAAAHWAHYMLRFVRFAFASTEEEVKGPEGGRENRMRHLNGLIPF